MVTLQSTIPAFLAKRLIKGYAPTQKKLDANAMLYKFRGPKVFMSLESERTWKVALRIPHMPMAIPIVKGDKPRPPIGIEAAYMSGKRTWKDRSTKAKIAWLKRTTMRRGESNSRSGRRDMSEEDLGVGSEDEEVDVSVP